MKTWEPEEVRSCLAHVSGHRLYTAFLLAVGLGMCKGEVLGLRWHDVDLEGGTLAVRHTVTAVEYGLVYGEPKTLRSRRSLPLDADMVAALRAHRVRQAEERLAWGPGWSNEHGLVHTREDRRPVHPDAFQRMWYGLLRSSGVRPSRFHDLRHTFATMALKAGVHLVVVSRLLGHSTTNLTADSYSHVNPQMQADAIAAVSGLYRR